MLRAGSNSCTWLRCSTLVVRWLVRATRYLNVWSLTKRRSPFLCNIRRFPKEFCCLESSMCFVLCALCSVLCVLCSRQSDTEQIWCWQEKQKFSEKTLSHCHSDHHKCHMYRPRIEFGPPIWTPLKYHTRMQLLLTENTVCDYYRYCHVKAVWGGNGCVVWEWVCCL